MTLNPVPSTIDAAVEMIVAEMTPRERAFVCKTECSPAAVHHGAGTKLRNEWSLWLPDSALKRDAVEKYGIAHADDISGLILAWVWAKVRGVAFDAVEFCRQYHEHWAKCGMTSLEAGGWPKGGGV